MNDESPASESSDRALRERLARVLARAVLDLRPGTRLGGGGATEDGFYYDFALAEPLSPDDFPAIESAMRALVAAGDPFECQPLMAAEAAAQLAAQDQALLAELATSRGGEIQLCRYRGLTDLLEAPLMAADLPADGFALRAIAGAYFQGDGSKIMLTRISAFAERSREALAQRRSAHERAAQRDHKKLGRELELFTFDDEIGPGLPLWLPNGTVIRDELEKLMRELEWDAGFERVSTPPIARQALYFRTGHLPYYADSMFPSMRGDDAERAVFSLRPMNCPHHHKVFASKRRSHRELPFRISEYGQVFRYEDSGAVSGLLRTRAMCMNDAHIYCAPDQVMAELRCVLAMHEHVYRILDLREYRVRLSTRGPLAEKRDKFVDDRAGWEHAEDLLRRVLIESGIAFFEGPGEAAFYGPKIDFQFRMVTGREETASTLQLDFASAARLDLSYVGPSGEACRPMILHRAPLGTHERFVAMLIERFAGAFPTWLAPHQVRVLPVSEANEAYAREVVASLRSVRIRADLQTGQESLGKRIRQAALLKIPNTLVVGAREQTNRSVALRRHGTSAQEALSLQDFQLRIARAIQTRTLEH